MAAWRFSPGTESPSALEWLASPKMLKFMGKQDRLAVAMAGQALTAAGFLQQENNESASSASPRDWQQRMGLYLSVGLLPFERENIEKITRLSTRDGKFDLQAFSKTAFPKVNPLLTFRCLPNMPAFHTSVSFGIRGHYFVTYPGIGQFYQAMLEAQTDLENRAVDFALLGGVADQDNFLVANRLKNERGFENVTGIDAAGWICLEREEDALSRKAPILSTLKNVALDYSATSETSFRESCFINEKKLNAPESHPVYLGAASLPIRLARALSQNEFVSFKHEVQTPDGFRAKSEWRKAS